MPYEGLDYRVRNAGRIGPQGQLSREDAPAPAGGRRILKKGLDAQYKGTSLTPPTGRISPPTKGCPRVLL